MILFKALLIAGLLLATTAYLTRGRSAGRDRALVLVLFAGLALAVVFPETTSWLAKRLGVGRGADLAFYLGFLLLFFLVSIQRARLQRQDRTITTLVREIALLKAKKPQRENAARPESE